MRYLTNFTYVILKIRNTPEICRISEVDGLQDAKNIIGDYTLRYAMQLRANGKLPHYIIEQSSLELFVKHRVATIDNDKRVYHTVPVLDIYDALLIDQPILFNDFRVFVPGGYSCN